MSSFRVRQYALWVRLYNLPFEAFTKAAGEFLGEALVEVVEVDVNDVFPRHFRYLRIKVTVTPESTLVGGFYLTIPGSLPRWIECRYERIYKFCRACGRVGHTYPQCGLSSTEARARVDEVINRLAAQFRTSVRTDESVPLYSNRTRAFARSNSRRNTHMWAVQQDLFPEQPQSVQGGGGGRRFQLLETDEEEESLHEEEEELHHGVDYEQFLEDYEAAWDWDYASLIWKCFKLVISLLCPRM